MCGSILSIYTVTLIIVYASFKLENLVKYKDYRVQENNQVDLYAQTDSFGYKFGFSFAAGINAWDSGEGFVEDPSYATMKFFLKSWGENAPYNDTFHEIGSHYCDSAEFNDVLGKNANSNFYPIAPSYEGDVIRYGHRLKCLDDPEHDLRLWGNYNTNSTANLVVALVKCDNNTASVTCKSEEEINEWLTFKYFTTIWNNKQFKHDKF